MKKKVVPFVPAIVEETRRELKATVSEAESMSVVIVPDGEIMFDVTGNTMVPMMARAHWALTDKKFALEWAKAVVAFLEKHQ